MTGKAQTQKENRKKRSSSDMSLSGGTARRASNTRHMG
jgi:hypothetical protein